MRYYRKKTKKVKNTVKAIQKSIAKITPELRQFITSVNTTITAGSLDAVRITCLNNMIGGDDEYQRTGNKIRVLSLTGNLTFAVPAVNNIMPAPWSSGAYCNYRVIILVDHDYSYGVPPTMSEILQFSGTASVRNQYNNDSVSAKRFRILYDKIKMVDYDSPEVVFTIKKKLNLPISFRDPAVDHYGHNSIYLCVLSDWVNTTSGGDPVTAGYFGLKFYDI